MSAGDRKNDEKATPAEFATALRTITPAKHAQIQSDIAAIDHTTPGARELGRVGDYKARAVDFASIRLHHNTPQSQGLVDGANFMVDPGVVPHGYVYVDSALDASRRPSVLSHETHETTLMHQHKWKYPPAHKAANTFEQQTLQEAPPQQLAQQNAAQQPSLPGLSPGPSPTGAMPPMIPGLPGGM